MMRKSYWKWIVVAVVFLLLGVAAWFYFRPKFLPMVQAVPSGAMAYVRADHLLENIHSFQSSRFFSDLTKVDIPGLMEHQGFGTQKIEEYKSFRKNIKALIDSPLFKQFFSREIAAALYPALDGFSNGQWPANLSGLLLVIRPEAGSKITQLLVNTWNQYSKEWVTTSRKYNGITITSIEMKSSGVTVYYARIRDLLAFSVDARVLQRVIDTVRIRQGGIHTDGHYAVLAGRFYSSSDGEAVLDIPAIRNSIKEYWSGMIKDRVAASEGFELDEPELRARLDELLAGLDGIQTSGGTWTAGMPVRLKWLIHFDLAKSSAALARLNSCESVNNPTIKLIPKDVMVYQWSSCLDFTELYDNFKAKIQQTAQTLGTGENPLSGLERAWGLRVEDDILPVLGRGFSWFVQGVDTSGMFPVPKFGLILKVKDQQAVDEILRKVATTPVTLVQSEEYRKVLVNYVSVPLVNALKPSYAFIDGFLVIVSTDKLLKQSIDASQDPLSGLAEDASFKQGANERSASDQMISFIKMQEVVKQSKILVEWAQMWFDKKFQQAQVDEQKAQKKLQALAVSIEEMKQNLIDSRQSLDELRQERKSLEAQIQAAAVSLEAKDTLSKEGPVHETSMPEEFRAEKLLEFKKSKISARELEINGLEKEIEKANAQQPSLVDAQNDMAVQKMDALKYRYYIEKVVIPVLFALESLVSQRVTTHIKDGMIDSEMLLIAQ